MSDKIRLARNLRLARVAARITQTAAAQLVGKSRQTINAWERESEGAASPDDTDLDVLARAYGTTRAALRYAETPSVISEDDIPGFEPVRQAGDPSAAQRARAVFRLGQVVRRHITDFLSEARKGQATEEELAFLRTALSPESIRALTSDSALERAPTIEEQQEYVEHRIRELRTWLKLRQRKRRREGRDGD